MANPNMTFHLRTLAGAELLDRTISPDDYRQALHTLEKPPPAADGKTQ
jgi:hypothetical protein